MNQNSFREYDIRGVAERDLPDATAYAIGLAIGEMATRSGSDVGASMFRQDCPDCGCRECADCERCTDHLQAETARRRESRVIAVGRDCRLTSPRLFAALTNGIRFHAEVLDIGVVPTPVLYFAAHHLKTDAAVMITGSHNPSEDNGFKIMLGTETVHGAAIGRLRDRVAVILADLHARQTRQLPKSYPTRTQDVTSAYLTYATTMLLRGDRKIKVVVDGGNGSGGPTAVALYTRLGFDVVPLFCDPDGQFPNHHPDPTQPENLVKLISTVQRTGAELGLALDGDADRLGAVDANGHILWGDQLMVIFGKAVLAEIPGARFVGEVKCSQVMYDELARAGGHVDMWKVGHSLIKERMKETGAQLAGEMSGHLFFAHRWLGFDDGIYAGARLLELLSRGDQTLADLAVQIPRAFNTPEIRVDCPDDEKFDVVARVTKSLRDDPVVLDVVDIDGVRARFADGWGLVRASNTQPVLVTRCEAIEKHALAEIRWRIEKHITQARSH